MIKLLDTNMNVLHLLSKVKNYYIESDLKTGDKLISFLLPRVDEAAIIIKQEMYLRTKEDEYVIKEINYQDKDYLEIFGKLNLTDLKGKMLNNVESVEHSIDYLLTQILSGTGWTHQMQQAISKLRTVRAESSSIFNLIADASKIYNIEFSFDTLNKKVNVYQTRGIDRGSYAYSDLNIKSSEFQSDSYDLVTRIYPYGKDKLDIKAVNGGVEYVEDFTFTNKVIEYIWVDERYEDAASLKEDALAKLAALSKPRASFKLNVMDLAQISSLYSYLDYRLGDVITVLDKTAKQVYNERIMHLIEYPLEPERNVVEMSNTMFSYAELQREATKNIENLASNIGAISLELNGFDAAVQEVSDTIKANYGGYVVTRYSENNEPYEILIMDNPDIMLAQNVIRMNQAGIGFSQTGYNGTYDTAITIDGRILGRFIEAETLSAISSNLGTITAGTIDASTVNITNLNASSIFVGGTTSVQDKINEFDAIQIGGRNLLPSSVLSQESYTTKEFEISAWATQLISKEDISSILESGEEYTISYDMELTETTNVPTLYALQAGLFLYSPGGNGSVSFFTDVLVNTGDKHRYVQTFTTPQLVDHRIIIYSNRYTTNGAEPAGFDTLKVTNLKIEKGNKATDWTPAPEDVSADIADRTAEVQETARIAAEDYANAQKVLAATDAAAYADDKISDAEGRAIAVANQNLATATQNLATAKGALEELIETRVSKETSTIKSYIRSDANGNLEIGSLSGNNSKLVQSPNAMTFMVDNMPVATFGSGETDMPKAGVDTELRIGDKTSNYHWVSDPDGGMSLIWK